LLILPNLQHIIEQICFTRKMHHPILGVLSAIEFHFEENFGKKC
jgi:hypothetical protein